MNSVNGIVRLCVLSLAAVGLLWTADPPDVAEACGAKLSVKGSKFHHARMAKASSSSRTPIATGPIDARARTVKASGGVEGRATVSAGGGETAPKRPRSKPVERTPRKVADAQPAADESKTKPIGDVDKRAGEEDKAPVADEPEPKPADPPTAREPKVKGKLPRLVFFGNAKAGLSPQARAALDKTARWLQQNPDKSITLEGHASTQGNASANQTLSERRAEAVKEYLVDKGVDESRVTTAAHGSDRPEFQPGSSAKNRRVVIVAN